MKKQWLLFLVFLQLTVTVVAQDKLALLVAIGQYPPASRIRPIAAVADLKFLKATLNSQGFTDKNIQTLINAQATKQGIINSLNALARKVKPGDIVLISFGCHGQQIRDQRTIELGKDEDDGYDEALIPYDARGTFSPTGYKGEKHLRDDELFPLLTAIRLKTGKNGSLIVLLDACHSGTGTRADDFPGSRGEPVPFPDPENPFDPTAIPDKDSKESLLDQAGDSLANMVVFSGAGPHQINKQVIAENEELGSLSWAFYAAMKELPPNADYQTLFNRMRALIQSRIPDQLPMIEGDTRQLVFSGRYSNAVERSIVRVGLKGSQLPADSLFTLNKGRLDQLVPGATGRIYINGTEQLVCTAVLKRTDPFASIGVASKPLNKTVAYEFRPDVEPVPALAANIRIDPQQPLSAPAEKALRQSLSPLPFIGVGNEKAQFTINAVKHDRDTELRLSDRSNRSLWTAPFRGDSLSADDRSALVNALRHALRIQYLRNLEDGGDLAARIDAQLVAANGEAVTAGLQLKEGDRYMLRISNNSSQRLFYTVLDIYPDNRMDVLYPFKGKEPADYSIAAGSFIERKLAVSPGSPKGLEMLKLIVSTEPLDLRMVIEEPGRRPGLRSVEVLMDQLFNQGNSGQAVRADFAAISAAEIGIRTLSFTIQQQ